MKKNIILGAISIVLLGISIFCIIYFSERIKYIMVFINKAIDNGLKPHSDDVKSLVNTIICIFLVIIFNIYSSYLLYRTIKQSRIINPNMTAEAAEAQRLAKIKKHEEKLEKLKK